MPLFLSGRDLLMYGPRHRNRFPYRPKGLRRAILAVLERSSDLNAAEIAGCAFSFGGPMVRPGWKIPSASQVVSVRRALRRLVATGKVKKCGRARRCASQRRRDTFELASKGRQ